MSNRRRRREARRHQLIGGAFLTSVVLTLIAASVIFIRSLSQYPDLDADDCPAAGPRAIYAIVLDSTDAIGAVTRRHLREEILNRAKMTERFTAVQIYVAGANPAALLKPTFRRCNPGNPDNVSIVNGNPKAAREAFEDGYRRPLANALDTDLVFQTVTQSPLMENLQAVSISAFPAGTEKIPRTLIIVSDLLQNSDQYSVYKGFSIETATEAARYYHAALQGVDVELLRIPRRKDMTLQLNQQFGVFWATWLAESGARLQKITPLQGMN